MVDGQVDDTCMATTDTYHIQRLHRAHSTKGITTNLPKKKWEESKRTSSNGARWKKRPPQRNRTPPQTAKRKQVVVLACITYIDASYLHLVAVLGWGAASAMMN